MEKKLIYTVNVLSLGFEDLIITDLITYLQKIAENLPKDAHISFEAQSRDGDMRVLAETSYSTLETDMQFKIRKLVLLEKKRIIEFNERAKLKELQEKYCD